MVEFALVIPIIVLVIAGILDIGWAVYADNTVALAAREGARKGILVSSSDDTIKAQVRQTATGLGDLGISIYPPTKRTPGQSVSVTVVYTYTSVTPLINAFGGGRFRLRSTASMMVE